MALVVRLVSQPSLAVALQSPKPLAQLTTVHALAAQPFVATWSSAQKRAHAPQFSGSTAALAQNVSGAVPQRSSGDAQVVPHAPPEQT